MRFDHGEGWLVAELTNNFCCLDVDCMMRGCLHVTKELEARISDQRIFWLNSGVSLRYNALARAS